MLRYHQRRKRSHFRKEPNACSRLPMLPGGVEEGGVELLSGSTEPAQLPYRISGENAEGPDAEALAIAFDQAGHPL